MDCLYLFISSLLFHRTLQSIQSLPLHSETSLLIWTHYFVLHGIRFPSFIRISLESTHYAMYLSFNRQSRPTTHHVLLRGNTGSSRSFQKRLTQTHMQVLPSLIPSTSIFLPEPFPKTDETPVIGLCNIEKSKDESCTRFLFLGVTPSWMTRRVK